MSFFSKISGILLFLSLFIRGFSQNGGPHSDCENALNISGSVLPQNIELNGPGKKNEIRRTTGSPHLFEKEHHSAWIRFQVQKDEILTFKIEGEKGHDVDFLLFKEEEGFCEKIRNGQVTPLRSNLARGTPTGLSAEATSEFVGEGPGELFSKAIRVKQGESYILVIDDVSGTGKVSAEIRDVFSIALSKEEVTDAAPVSVTPVVPQAHVSVKITDKNTGLPVKAKLDITGLNEGGTVRFDTTELRIDLAPLQRISVNVNAYGYLFNSLNYTASSDGGEDEILVTVKPLEAGDKVTLGEIKFEGDNAEFLGSSKNSLLNLVRFMRENPNTVIEIQGHVNGQMRNSMKLKRLSKKRAKAVRDYLISFGIDGKRMKYKGFGNKFMIHPEPENERQAEANRRVEIKILSK